MQAIKFISLLAFTLSYSCSQKSGFSGGSAVVKNYDAVYGKGVELRNTPSDPSNVTRLAVQVVGENVDKYQYSVLEGDVACDGSKYSAERSIDETITDKIEGPEGIRKICVIGKGADTGYQSVATEYSWNFDGTPPGDFSIQNLKIVDRKPPTYIEWSKSDDAVSYSFKIFKGPDCSGEVLKEETLPGLKIDLPELEHGKHSVCVVAIDEVDNRADALNSPFNFEVFLNPVDLQVDAICGPKSITCGGPTIAYIPYVITTTDIGGSALSKLEVQIEDPAGKFLKTASTPPLASFSSAVPVKNEIQHSAGANVSTQSVLPKSLLLNKSGTYKVTAFATDLAGNTSSITKTFIWDDNLPVISSYTVHNNVAISSKPFVSSAVVANDSTTDVFEMCKKSVVGATSPSPAGCTWMPYLGVKNTIIGHVPEVYTMQVWVRDQALNESLVKEDTVEFDPSLVPEFLTVVAANKNNPANPPSESERTVAANAPIHIKWIVKDDTNLPAQHIHLEYTHDDVTWVRMASDLGGGSNGKVCTPPTASGVVLSAKIVAGCYVGSIASSAYIKIRVVAVDVDSQVSYSTAAPLNLPKVNFIAGNTEIGIGASARSTVFQNAVETLVHPDIGSLVVTSRGEFVFRDFRRGLMIVRPDSGVLMTLVGEHKTPRAYSAAGVLVNITPSLKLYSVVGIAKDYQDRILVLEADRLSRIDISTPIPTIERLAGGGSQVGDSVSDALSLKIDAIKNGRDSRTLYALPSGKIVFASESDAGFQNPYNRLRIYTPNANRNLAGTISSRNFTGTFSFVGESGTRRAEDCRGWNKAIGFSRVGSSGETFNAATLVLHGENDPQVLTNCQTSAGYRVRHHSVKTTSLSSNNFVIDDQSNLDISQTSGVYLWGAPHVGLDGKIYFVDRAYGSLARYNTTTKTFDRIAGSGETGRCDDNVSALSCRFDPQDIFVDESSTVYFMDLGRVRTIQNGKVVTIMGQSYGYGEGLNPLVARFGDINRLAHYVSNSSRKIVVLDALENIFREVELGKVIKRIAGSGLRAHPVMGQNALDQPLDLIAYGQTIDDFTSTPTGDLIFRTNLEFIKLNRTTGNWEALSGTTSPLVKWNLAVSGSSLLQNIRLNTTGVYSKILGFVNNEFIALSTIFDPYSAYDDAHRDTALMKFNLATTGANAGAYTKLAGKQGLVPSRLAQIRCTMSGSAPDCSMLPSNSPIQNATCTMGGLATNCSLPTSYSVAYNPIKEVYRATSSGVSAGYEYLYMPSSQRNIYVIDRQGKINIYETLPENALSMAVKPGSGAIADTIYYCAAGKIKMKSKGSTTVAELNIGPGAACAGREIVYNAATNSLLYIYANNNLNAIAEIVNP